MLKHTDLTRNRIQSFLQTELKPRIYGERSALKIEINTNPCENQHEAMKGPWVEVTKGYQYGPA